MRLLAERLSAFKAAKLRLLTHFAERAVYSQVHTESRLLRFLNPNA